MKINLLCLTAFLCFIMAACSDSTEKTADLPQPNELYTEIEEAAGLTEMIELTAEELTNLTGIEPDMYTSFAAYQAGWGMSPDEIIIIQAADTENITGIEEKLSARLEYKRKSAEDYLTENLPILNKSVVRCDGLTISMIVTDDIESALGTFSQ